MVEINPYREVSEWRDVSVHDASSLYSTQDGLPVPKTIEEPGHVTGDFKQRLKESSGVTSSNCSQRKIHDN